MNRKSPCGIGRSPSPLIPLPPGEGDSSRTVLDNLERVRLRQLFMVVVRVCRTWKLLKNKLAAL